MRGREIVVVGVVSALGCGAPPSTPAPAGASPSETDVPASPVALPPGVPSTLARPWPSAGAAEPVALDLSGVTFDVGAGANLAGCLPLQRDLNPSVLHAAPGDLDGDGQVEVVLGNQRCPNAAGAWVDDPVARWDAATAQLVVGESFAEHFAAPPDDFGPSMAFLDVDADGDADLVGSVRDRLQPARLLPVWENDGTGRFSAVAYGPSLAGRSLTAVGAFGVIVGGDGRLHLWLGARASGDPPTAPVPPADVVWAGGVLEASVFDDAAVVELPGAWAWLSVSSRPTEQPFEYLFPTVNAVGGPHDYHLRVSDGAWQGDDFVDAARGTRGEPVDALLFADPTCALASPTCFNPMGGSTLRLPERDAAGSPAWRDCAGISTGNNAWPVFVTCPEGGRFLEHGALAAALRGPTTPDVRLAWQVSATWDVNADGVHDVIVTNGRDAGPFPPQPSYAYLRRSGCFDDACGRYVRTEWPIPWGHHHGFALVPVPRTDGGWSWLGLANSNAVDPEADARIAAFRWSPADEDAWVSLALGPLHDLRGMGTVVTPAFVDGRGAVVSVGEPTLVSLASTRGHPGLQQALVWGLPPGAVSAVATVAPVGGGTPFDVVLQAGQPTVVSP